MNALRNTLSGGFAAALLAAIPAFAQVPVDDSGQPIGDYARDDRSLETGNEGIPLLDPVELEDLVGPVALYPDDLLAIVLPASTFPLQLVQAQRFLDDLEDDPSLKPDEDWDDSVIALLNYPEVLKLLNEDLDWTWQLGEAVVAQHSDVVAAVEGFRNRAFAAGNLHSDEHQTVSDDGGAIQISPVDDDIIYVPYYEPERAVVYQPEPVIRYYPQAYPVYYYPYPSGHAFRSGFFWGVTTAYSLGWVTNRVHVIHHSYRAHPYYGRSYWNGWWYRRPSIHVHNHYYSNNRTTVNRTHYSRGDAWRPRHESRRRLSNQRIVHSSYYARGNRSERVRVSRTTRSSARDDRHASTTRSGNSVRQSGSRRDSRSLPATTNVVRTRPATTNVAPARPAATTERPRVNRQPPAQRQVTRTADRREVERTTRRQAERQPAPQQEAPRVRERPANDRNTERQSRSRSEERPARERKERSNSRSRARNREEH